MGEKYHRLFNLILHSIAQNNVTASFMAPTLHNIEKRLNDVAKLVALSNIECNETNEKFDQLEAIVADVILGKTGHQGPPPPLTSHNDKIDLIARKVMAIEQKVKKVKPAGNPPGPQNKNLKNEGPQGVKQKDAEEKNWNEWYQQVLKDSSTTRIALWAAMVCSSKWGKPSGDTVEVINHRSADCDELTAFICRAISHHYRKGQSGTFLMPPAQPIEFTRGWSSSFFWCIIDRFGNTTDCEQKRTVYAPGKNLNTKTTTTPTGQNVTAKPPPVNMSSKPKPTESKGKQRAVEPTDFYLEEPWQDTPQRGAKPKNVTPKKSFAQITALASKPKITAPQSKYDNVPTARFMAPMPRKPPPRRSYGKKYILRFHRDEKPTEGTKLDTRVVTSEINRTCSEFNVKANSAEWTSALNLLIYFTHDSTDSQIEKVKKTILGALARGCSTKTVFMKSVKWSRIVVRDMPTHKWVHKEPVMGEEELGQPTGEFIPITKEDMESSLHAAHPILENTIFLEGPDWTDRSGRPPTDAE